jgi:serine/threonine-protein kinase SRK2
LCHNDIKLENMMLDEYRLNVKICDFGFAGGVVHELGHVKGGTPSYMAPELYEECGTSFDNQACDAWACGVVLYVMLFGGYPFDRPALPAQTTIREVRRMQKAIDGRLWPNPFSVMLSEACIDLLNGVLTRDCAKRLTVAQMLSHPWLQ